MLTHLRMKMGKSKNSILDKVDVDVSKYECGKCYPKADAIEKLCGFYKINPIIFHMVAEVYVRKGIDRKTALGVLTDPGLQNMLWETFSALIISQSKETG